MYYVLVWLHIVAAVTWIGSAMFLALVLGPVMRNPRYASIVRPLLTAVGPRLRLLGWVCLCTLLFSGASLLGYHGVHMAQLTDPVFWSGSLGQTLGVKLLLVLVILILSAYHDFVLGPRATSTEALSIRRRAAWFGRATLVLALIVVAFGTFLVRGRPW